MKDPIREAALEIARLNRSGNGYLSADDMTNIIRAKLAAAAPAMEYHKKMGDIMFGEYRERKAIRAKLGLGSE